jgi:hypothetical protein
MHHRAERKLRRAVARLSGCLDRLATVQQRVLVLRTGLGSARPHSRRGVARLLHVRVRRVMRIEHRGLRKARALSRAGACGGTSSGSGSAGVTGLASSGGGGGDDGGSGAVPEPTTGGDGGSADTGTSSDGSSGGSGDVRGESETQLPPPLGGRGSAEATGVSLAIGIFLILLALLAGFATPHLRGRLGSS